MHKTEEILGWLSYWYQQCSKSDAPEDRRFLRFCMENLSISRSQHQQDLWVLYELNDRHGGYFVEFGAADGVHLSNSLLLESKFGWHGIAAEPCRSYFPGLAANRHCIVDDRCVWNRSGEILTFNETRALELSTIDQFSSCDGHAHNRADGQRYEVETISLNDLLDHHRAPSRIDYMSVDTEGSEVDILSAFDFDRYDVRLITVEHNHTPSRDGLYDLLTSKGYERKFADISRTDDWYIKRY